MRTQTFALMLLALAAISGAGTSKLAAQTATPPAAPNPCTNVAEATCATVAGCVWLPGYKVKGGPDIKGYCRPAPKSLSSRRPGDPAPK